MTREEYHGTIHFAMPGCLEPDTDSAWFAVNSPVYMKQVRSLLREPGNVTYSLQHGVITRHSEPIELLWPSLRELGYWCHRKIQTRLPRAWVYSRLGDWLSYRIGWPRRMVTPSEFAWEPIVKITHVGIGDYVKTLEEPAVLSEGEFLRVWIDSVGKEDCPEGLQVMAMVNHASTVAARMS